jgi:GT2 family glycosyltransferase
MGEKVDVVVCYYRHGAYLDRLVKSLQANLDHINHVYIVNDALWTQDAFCKDWPEWITLLSHPHEGFGLCKSANQGIAAAKTDFVLLMEADELLAPGSLETTLKAKKPKLLVCGKKAYIDEKSSFEEPQFLDEYDHRLDMVHEPNQDPRRAYVYCSGGHLLIDRAFHTAIGGFDERMGYGLHDYEYAARWLQNGGGLIFGGGYVWHLGTGGGREMPSEWNYKIYARTLADIFGHRYNIACGYKFEYDYVNVDIAKGITSDVKLDCKRLDWIEPGTAQEIKHSHFIEHLTPFEAAEHLQHVYTALAPGGILKIECPDLDKCIRMIQHPQSFADEWNGMEGIFGDTDTRHEGESMVHRWGWSLRTLTRVLEEIGFEIDEAGDSKGYTAARDLYIEATKPEEDDE